MDRPKALIRAGEVKAQPAEIAAGQGTRAALGDAGGLTQFGAHLDTLEPGARSSDLHWHEREDEFLYVLEGEATVLGPDGAETLKPGDAACWPAGLPHAHSVENRTQAPLSFLVIGTRAAGDTVHYPELGRTLRNGADRWALHDSEGRILKQGDLPPRLGALPDRAVDPSPGGRRVVRAGSVAPVSGSNYPLPLRTTGPYRAWPFSDEGGLTQFGAFTEELPPGASSSHRHWHEAEDEFLYVLKGCVTVIDNAGPHDLMPGDAACWRAGDGNAHHLVNRTGAPVLYLVAGSRMPDDEVHYPDVDLHYSRKGAVRRQMRKDGTLWN